MPSTVLDLMNDAALRLGAVQLGEPLSANESAALLAVWQRLIASESILRKTVFTEREDQYTLTSGIQTYTLGTDPNSSTIGTLSAVRPNRISRANLVMAGTPTTELPLEVIEDTNDWSDINVKNFLSLPLRLYRDGGAPLDTWYFHPIPNAAYTVKVWTWQKLAQGLDLTDYVAFPDGYERFWVTKLAIEASPIFGLEPSPSLRETAWQAEQNIRSLNSRSPRMKMDPSFLSRRGNSYNWLTGLTGGRL